MFLSHCYPQKLLVTGDCFGDKHLASPAEYALNVEHDVPRVHRTLTDRGLPRRVTV